MGKDNSKDNTKVIEFNEIKYIDSSDDEESSVEYLKKVEKKIEDKGKDEEFQNIPLEKIADTTKLIMQTVYNQVVKHKEQLKTEYESRVLMTRFLHTSLYQQRVKIIENITFQYELMENNYNQNQTIDPTYLYGQFKILLAQVPLNYFSQPCELWSILNNAMQLLDNHITQEEKKKQSQKNINKEQIERSLSTLARRDSISQQTNKIKEANDKISQLEKRLEEIIQKQLQRDQELKTLQNIEFEDDEFENSKEEKKIELPKESTNILKWCFKGSGH